MMKRKSTTLLVYCSAIYPQGMTFKYGLGGRLGIALLFMETMHEWINPQHSVCSVVQRRVDAVIVWQILFV